MKKALPIALTVALGITLSGCTAETETVSSSTYPKAAYVAALDYDTNTVTVEDSTGHLWDFYGIEDWCEGDIVAMIMDDNGTPDVYDDKIVSINFSGWWMEE